MLSWKNKENQREVMERDKDDKEPQEDHSAFKEDFSEHVNNSKNDDEKCDFFFEGAEKLLELWFTTKKKSGSDCDLRDIPRFK